MAIKVRVATHILRQLTRPGTTITTPDGQQVTVKQGLPDDVTLLAAKIRDGSELLELTFQNNGPGTVVRDVLFSVKPAAPGAARALELVAALPAMEHAERLVALESLVELAPEVARA